MKRKGQKAEASRIEKDDILPEYDFSDSRPNNMLRAMRQAAP
jgi:hypothetical protein